jgi:branched-chain amino acid aminotransferase
MDFILYNGKIIPGADYHPGMNFWMVDLSLSQDMWFANGDIPHFIPHFREFISLLNKLERTLPNDFPPRDELQRLSKRLINKNKAFMGGWLTLRFSFKGNDMEYFITVRPHSERIFPLDPIGKTGIISPFVKYSGNPLSCYHFFSESLWKTEQFRSENSENEEYFFLNEKGMLTEACGANLFCIKNNQLWTPAEETGCIVDSMREHVILSAQVIGFQIIRSDSISPSGLNEMEEIFLVSEGTGFKWIMGMGTKRFLKNRLELIWRQVNKSCFPKVS